MSRFDYKEAWAEFYEEALEQGLSEADADFYATKNATDRLAQLADDAHDRAKGN